MLIFFSYQKIVAERVQQELDESWSLEKVLSACPGALAESCSGGWDVRILKRYSTS
ncbi:hypothetical protein KBD11_00740 [Candidatus Saccharibacteria bacterium]|nr:hypothetical protein [Candidatus Saccharibacteria bacterium]